MSTDAPPNSFSQPASSSTQGVSGTPLAAQSALPVIPIAPTRPLLADEIIRAGPAQNLNIVRDLTLFVRVLRQAEGGRWVMAIFLASTVVTIANMFGQVELNE